jgi:hypothetical protein
MQDSAPVPIAPTTIEPSARPPVRPSALADAWPGILADVGARSKFLGAALAATIPGEIEGGALPVVLSESNPLFAERIQAEARAVEEAVQRHTGQAVRIRVTVAEGQPAEPRPRAMTESSVRADRLRAFRAKDPTLDRAADALDLEIVD